MSLGQRFERRLEGLVGGAFARVFKGQVEPVEIGTALQREAADKRNVMGNGKVLTPNRYRVTLSSSDHERLIPWDEQLTTSLAELVQEYLDSNNWETIGDIEVYLALDAELHTGVFGVASRMEPGAPPRRRPHDSLSMPIVPGAAPGAYPDPPAGGFASMSPGAAGGFGAAHPGQDRGPNGYGDEFVQPDYAQPDHAQPNHAQPDYAHADYAQPEQAPPLEYAPPGYGQGGYDPNAQGGYPQNVGQEQFGHDQYPPAPQYAPAAPYPPAPQYAPPPPPPPPAPPRRAAAMLIVDQSNRRFDLRSGSNVIGRGTESDLQLLDQGISRRHVDIQFDGNYATAYDLGSTNGTTVNGHEISSQMLRHGDVIRVGHTRIVFHQERP